MTLDNMTGITKGSYTGFCKSQLITCNFVKACNGVCPFEDALKHADKTQTMNEQHNVDHDRETIDHAPTIEDVQGWIPVSERLPEDIKPVIITWKNTDPASYYQYIVGKHFTGTGHYCNGKWFWYSSVCEDLLAEYGKSDIDELDEAIEVIAWMPLPEPYRKDGEE